LVALASLSTVSKPHVGLLALGVVMALGLLATWVLVLPRWLAPDVPDEVLGPISERARLEATNARVKLRNDLRTTPLQAIAWLAALAGAVLAFQQLTADRQQADADRNVTQQGQASERFTRAISDLGNQRSEGQLSGVYGLEKIAQQAPENRLAVTEILISYLHRRIPLPANKNPARRWPSDDLSVEELGVRAPDAQAALTVLGRRQITSTDNPLDLRELDLRRADLRGANLSFANFEGSDLHLAKLGDPNLSDPEPRGADLRSASFYDTNLSGADFSDANLRGANLSAYAERSASFVNADLREANLNEAKLGGANLSGADLRGIGNNIRIADLSGTVLFGTDLRGVHFFDANLYGARCDRDTKWPDGFDWQDHGARLEPGSHPEWYRGPQAARTS
jgi:uncharacterized protein YjbI with pentapeptide repeats